MIRRSRPNRQERGLVRISAETSAMVLLLAVLAIAGMAHAPKVWDWLHGKGSLTMSSQAPTQENIDEIMAELLGDASDIGDFGLFFPYIREALLENIYPYNRLLQNDLSTYADLPDMSPNLISVRGSDGRWGLVFSFSAQRFDSQTGQELANVVVRVHPPEGRPTRQSFRLDQAGQSSLQTYLEEFSNQVVGWDEGRVTRYAVNLSYSTHPVPEMPDQEEFFGEIGRLGIPGLGSSPSSAITFFWDHNYFMDDNGARVFAQYLRVTLPNNQSGPPYLQYSIALKDGEILVHGDVARFDLRHPASSFPFLAAMLAS